METHRIISEKIVPTLSALRSAGIAVIHAQHDREAHPLVAPLPGETVFAGEFMDAEIVAGALRDAGLKQLVYMGFWSNVCILTRGIGMYAMMKRGFQTTLVRDASCAIESVESADGQWFHKAAVHFIEINVGATVSATEVQSAVAEALKR